MLCCHEFSTVPQYLITSETGAEERSFWKWGRRRSRLYMYARFTSELLSSSRGLKPVIAADTSGEFKRDILSSGVTDVSVGLLRLLSGIYPIHEPIYTSGLGVLSFSPHLASSRSLSFFLALAKPEDKTKWSAPIIAACARIQ